MEWGYALPPRLIKKDEVYLSSASQHTSPAMCDRARPIPLSRPQCDLQVALHSAGLFTGGGVNRVAIDIFAGTHSPPSNSIGCIGRP